MVASGRVASGQCPVLRLEHNNHEHRQAEPRSRSGDGFRERGVERASQAGFPSKDSKVYGGRRCCDRDKGRRNLADASPGRRCCDRDKGRRILADDQVDAAATETRAAEFSPTRAQVDIAATETRAAEFSPMTR
ncbi:unnamed protein product [Effrenium voratum]|nr:unnamed protein product [Effrenium voratum]